MLCNLTRRYHDRTVSVVTGRLPSACNDCTTQYARPPSVHSGGPHKGPDTVAEHTHFHPPSTSLK